MKILFKTDLVCYSVKFKLIDFASNINGLLVDFCAIECNTMLFIMISKLLYLLLGKGGW